ncbi:MAG TPA: ribosome maturation factor RimM [Streptosporangiaceae bacterium]|nr:ribosome maturation factor RimM [Streptosporangiaceae bacterium]
MQVVVGRIARPHGIRGDLTVEVRTDEPERRFTVGAVLATDPADRGPLTLSASRWHSGQLLVRFDEVPDRTAAEQLRGTWLVLDTAEIGAADDPDEFYDHELIGLTAVRSGGEPVGEVTDVLHHGQDLLVVTPPGGGELLVPFVAAIVPEVDVAAGRLVIDPPPGLLDP